MADRRIIVVYPPDEQGARRVRIDGSTIGRATDLADLVIWLRRAGLEVDDIDVVRSPLIEWRGGGGPEAWDESDELPHA
ncbi:hypothetical protein ACFYM2_21005 [Streptomyces sp. NPDC006711]|uniref:hypothetical protein n=1 Tax=Streptomyces sp. NPDC006711 TaxID=3364762 RepID=UPI0036915DC7